MNYRLILIILSGLACHASAQTTDVNAPISISAKSTFVDGVSKMSVYKDEVVVIQAGLTINAQTLSIDASAGEGKEVFIASGEPATFTQLLEDGSSVTAAANQIRYNVISRTVTFSGNAELAQETSVVKSQTIEFDLINKQLVANADKNEGGRVTTVFQPEILKQQIQEKESEKD